MKAVLAKLKWLPAVHCRRKRLGRPGCVLTSIFEMGRCEMPSFRWKSGKCPQTECNKKQWEGSFRIRRFIGGQKSGGLRWNLPSQYFVNISISSRLESARNREAPRTWRDLSSIFAACAWTQREIPSKIAKKTGDNSRRRKSVLSPHQLAKQMGSVPPGLYDSDSAKLSGSREMRLCLSAGTRKNCSRCHPDGMLKDLGVSRILPQPRRGQFRKSQVIASPANLPA